MERIEISLTRFQDQVLGCWMGKNIGGTLGTPYECLRHTHALEFYDPVPKEPAPNDDLDLQLVWLKLLEDHGTDPPLPLLAEYWSQHAASYPWNEYGFFMRNYSRGLRAPVAGCFENYFVDEEGSPIRSEIWACLHAGDPQAAAEAAWKDSALDHAGGEGMYGEMFLAALEAAAFVERDPLTLIRIGLEMIPLASHAGRCIREAVWCWENGLNWGRARERVASRFAGLQPCHAVPNSGFVILGWLYGKDFGDRLCKAVNCGYDTDCTGATLGSILGILDGASAIPERWLRPVGRQIVTHKFTRNFTPPATLDELAERTVALARKAAEGKKEIAFAARERLPADLHSRLFRNERARTALAQDVHMGVELCGGKSVEFHYGGEPVLRPGIAREVAVTVNGLASPGVSLRVPKGWTCEDLGGGRFCLSCAGAVPDRNAVTVVLPGAGEASFTVLGPGEAKGFAAGANVPGCSKCGARIEACICEGK